MADEGDDVLLLESGDHLLQEDGTSKFLLEQQAGGAGLSIPVAMYSYRRRRE